MREGFKPRKKSPPARSPGGQGRPRSGNSASPADTRRGNRPAPFKKRTARSGHAEGSRHLARGLRIVHEDDDVLVVDKPAGMLTAGEVGSPGESVFNYLKSYVRDAARRRGTRLWIIHRLDREASGLLVFAKSERAYDALKAEFKTKRAHRIYCAVVEGEPPGDDGAGTVQSYLWEDDRGIVHSTQTPSTLDGKPARGSLPMRAVTHYKVRHAGQGRIMLAVRLDTGRKNQIRVHMKDLGRPIVGDRRYGAATDPLGRVCLHATELGFTHPVTRRAVRFVSEPPGAFYGLVGASRPAGVSDTGDSREDEGRSSPANAPASPPAAPDSWDAVAGWYDQLLDERGSDHYERVILPGVLRLLEPSPGERVVDVACGQGVLGRRLAAAGVAGVGIDASPELIERAAAAGAPGWTYATGDARAMEGVGAPGEFDHGVCVMALMNIEPIGPVLAGAARLIRAGGRFVAVILHPAFRSPGRTGWGWDAPAPGPSRGMPFPGRVGARHSHQKPAAGGPRQFRRVEAYLSEDRREIVMNPGAAANGATPVTTVTYHRPIGAYVRAFAAAGLLVDALEEWASARRSEPGPRASEENRLRAEIPMFLAIRGVRAESTTMGAARV